MTSATHIIDWTKFRLTLPVTIETTPETIYIGDKVTIRLYSAESYTLISPYNGLSSKSIEVRADEITEIIDVSGNNEIRSKYPIKELISLVVVMPLVDENSRTVVNTPIRQLVAVVNQQLKIINNNLKLHGSIKLVYKTFDTQVWVHSAFSKKGRALLFAQSDNTLNHENVPLTINERTNSVNDSIRIEPWSSQPRRGFNPYHTVIIYPANKKLKVKADYGTVSFVKKEVHEIKQEQINFNGAEATTSYPIKRFIKLTGVFFDAAGNEIEPTFRADNGTIKANRDCCGIGYAEYETEGLVYDYQAEVTIAPPPTPATNIRIGNIFAFEKGKKGVTASYTVPPWQNATIQRIDFYTVTRKILTQEIGTFEYPPNWSSDDNSYPNAPAAPENERPIVGDPTIVIDKVVEAGWVDVSGSIDFDTHSNIFFNPYFGSPENPDATYQINESIPSDITDTYLINKMQDAINDAKQRWGIV